MQSIRVKTLRPTQIAVGRLLVKIKRRDLRERLKQPQELVDYIVANPIRVVLGPEGRAYIIDHHHLGQALLKEGFKTVPLMVEDDLSKLTPDVFWRTMEERRWVYPFDGRGQRRSIRDIPKRLEDMEDDPYRSLAARVRNAGGFEKTSAPYVEFRWANYFRPLIKSSLIKRDFDKALKKAIALAGQSDARDLPGYIGEGVRT
jgi:hypothetical protein